MRFITLSATLAFSTFVWNVVGAAQTVKYAYDALGRLTDVNIEGGPGSGVSQNFQYDAAGNRLHQTVQAPGQSPASLSVPGTNVNITSTGISLTVDVAGATGGTVTFTENGVFIGMAWVVDGEASIGVEGFPAGIHSITATYSGDGVHQPQVSTFSIKVQDLRWLPAVLQLLLS